MTNGISLLRELANQLEKESEFANTAIILLERICSSINSSGLQIYCEKMDENKDPCKAILEAEKLLKEIKEVFGHEINS